ncbi:cytochrome B [Roseivirga sp. 4D4]|uniref:cytochrome B n=1 Tax=Roseivirga sp. 4D4 TaxID=1889784 RepID=UPI00085313B2|nr:cytochrome B [Roseivirga sp. 4D4]OEK01821.1 cytochrome B [Roseivirga sp. 4D4]
MYNGLLHMHSGLRWVVLVLLIAAIYNAFSKKSSGIWTAKDKKITLFAMVFTHIQLLVGLALYFINMSSSEVVKKVSFAEGFMKSSMLRFYTVEHISLMLIAIALITVGYSKAKRAASDAKKFGAVATFYLIGLILILASIPWPFRNLGAGWF